MQPARRGRTIWAIGIYEGDSPFTLGPSPVVRSPVLTCEDVKDIEAAFLADPFMLREGDLWYMFCEVKNARSRHGEIAVATSRDGYVWDYQGTVIREPFHLSYPCAVSCDGSYFMTMETLAEEAIWLYEAVRFPFEWRRVQKLVPGIYADPTLFCHDGIWWMYACGAPFRHDTLSLFHAPSPLGPWQEHRQSPIVRGNPAGARPGGRPLFWNGKLYRFAQDCVAAYGNKVRAFEVDELTTETYREHEIEKSPILSPCEPWNASGMHHIDAYQREDGRWMACVDGYFVEPVPTP